MKRLLVLCLLLATGVSSVLAQGGSESLTVAKTTGDLRPPSAGSVNFGLNTFRQNGVVYNFGSMATQSANAVNITGGTISGVTYTGNIFSGAGTVPPGGVAGQVLTKNSGNAYDLIWADPTGGGSGATSFLGLSDTPVSYAGQGGLGVAVKADATALEFTPIVPVNRTIVAGAGLTGGGDLSANRTISMTEPGTVSVSSGNVVGTGHTHAILWSSAPSSASILASDASGSLSLANLGATGTTFDLVNTTATTVNFAGVASALNIGANTGKATLRSAIVEFSGGLLQPTLPYTTDIGSLTKKFRSLYAAELWVETLVAQDTMATIGGRILVGPTTTLIADLSSSATTIQVKHNNLSNGSRVYMESSGKVEFLNVTSVATPLIGGGFQYSVQRNQDLSGPNDWFTGDAVFNTGQVGSGWIDLYSITGMNDALRLGPSIVGNVRTGLEYNDYAERWALGNLNGVYHYSANTYGFAAGNKAATWIGADADNGFRIMSGTTNIGQWDAAGNMRVGRADASNLYVTSGGVLQIRNSSDPLMQLSTSGALFGKAEASRPNMFYNLSNNRLEFRSNTTAQTYIDTDGSFVAGGGAVKLDALGLRITPLTTVGTTTSVRWVDGTTDIAALSATSSGSVGANIRLASRSLSTATTGYASTTLETISGDTGTTLGQFTIRGNGSAATNPSGVYATLTGSSPTVGLMGLTIGSFDAPTAMLDVRGTGKFTNNVTVGTASTGTTSTLLTVDGGSGTGAGSQLRLMANGTISLTLGSENTIVGSGSNTKATIYSPNAAYRLWGLGAGTLTTDANGNLIVSSDERLKDIEGDFTRGLKELRSLQPKIGKWKEGTGLDRTQSYVWPAIAKQLLASIPEAVSIDADGNYTVDQNALSAAYLNAIKELDARVSKLEGASAAPTPAAPDNRSTERVAELNRAALKRQQSERKPENTPSPAEDEDL